MRCSASACLNATARLQSETAETIAGKTAQSRNSRSRHGPCIYTHMNAPPMTDKPAVVSAATRTGWLDRLWPNCAADFRSHASDPGRPGFYVMLVYRFGRWRYGLRWRPLRRLCSFIYKTMYFFVRIATGIELPCEVPVGRNFRIEHQSAIVISGYASFGDDCVIRQGVTLGLRHSDEPCAPQIGNRVSIGAGAKLLGNLRVGNDVEIGANAVVLCDVPDNSIAVGIPARILPRSVNTGAERSA